MLGLHYGKYMCINSKQIVRLKDGCGMFLTKVVLGIVEDQDI